MSCLRHPRTAQERRATIGFLAEIEEYPEISKKIIRLSRGGKFSLPTEREDLVKSRIDNHSWKNYRRKQYK